LAPGLGTRQSTPHIATSSPRRAPVPTAAGGETQGHLDEYREEKISSPHWGSDLDQPAHSKVLYQLNYPGFCKTKRFK